MFKAPTIEELKTLIYCSSGRLKDWKGTGSPCEGGFTTPTIDRVAFPETPKDWFWSSSPYSGYSSHAWSAYFGYGYVGYYDKNGKRDVRLVRFSSDGLAREVAEAIEANCRSGADGLKAYLQEHADERIDVWRAAAVVGQPGAQWLLGMCYLIGVGVTQVDDQAVAWCRKAAEQGHAGAQYTLGEMCRTGWCGVAQDDTQAVALYRKAAEQGHAEAQYMLGALYAEGRGVKQDDVQAASWYRKAAEQGHAEAQQKLDGEGGAGVTLTAIGSAIGGVLGFLLGSSYTR